LNVSNIPSKLTLETPAKQEGEWVGGAGFRKGIKTLSPQLVQIIAQNGLTRLINRRRRTPLGGCSQ
jgi:hypothetical protein